MPEIKESKTDTNISAETIRDTDVRKPETGLIDLKKDREPMVPRGVKTWMEKLEEDPGLNQNNSNTNDDDSVLQPIAPAVTKIILPTNRATFTGGFIKPIDQAWRWLSEFVLRIIKKNKGNVKFK